MVLAKIVIGLRCWKNFKPTIGSVDIVIPTAGHKGSWFSSHIQSQTAMSSNENQSYNAVIQWLNNIVDLDEVTDPNGTSLGRNAIK